MKEATQALVDSSWMDLATDEFPDAWDIQSLNGEVTR